ncbi:MAG: phosphomannomutase/phosphoglucomutase, partial [Candidatus Levybacteria bacterium]|nr:phosphomannomutase/phosphoglucomutase [Candidatus Levybacteria bacterium]
ETEKKDEIIKEIEKIYGDGKKEYIDGLSVEYDKWRFNLRKSNTEPFLRLNLEAKSSELMVEKRDEMVSLIKSYG